MFRHLWYFHVFHVWAWSDCQMGVWGRKSNRGISTTNKPKRTIQRTNKPNLVDQFQSNCWEIYEVKWSCSLRRAWMHSIQPPFLCIPKTKPSSIQIVWFCNALTSPISAKKSARAEESSLKRNKEQHVQVKHLQIVKLHHPLHPTSFPTPTFPLLSRLFGPLLAGSWYG